MEKVSKPKPNPGRQRYLLKDEKQRLLSEAKKSPCPFLYPIIVLTLATGMRRSKIMKLKIGDVSLSNQAIRECLKTYFLKMKPGKKDLFKIR